MNEHDQDGFDPRIADWLEDDPDSAPDEALRIVLAAVPSIRQTRGLTARWRFTSMQQTTKVALGLVAVVAIAAGGLYLLGPTSTPGVGGQTSPSPSASTPSPSAASGASAPAEPSGNDLDDEPTILAVTATDTGCSAPPNQLNRGPLPPDSVAWITVTNESAASVVFLLDKADDAAEYEEFRLYMKAEHERALAGEPLAGRPAYIDGGASREVGPGGTSRFLAPTGIGVYGVACIPQGDGGDVGAFLVGPLRVAP